MKKNYTLKKLFSFLAFIFFASFVYGQTNIYTETFNDTLNFVNTPDFQTDGYGDYFWWGQDGDFGMVDLIGEDGTHYIGAEDTNGDGMPGECVILLPSVSLTGYSNVMASVMLAAPRIDAYDDADYIIFEYEKNGSGTFDTLAAFYGHDWVNSDPYNGPLREDTNFDGFANEFGTELTSTFQTFSYAIDPTATSVVLRLRFRMDSGNEELGVDNIQLTDMPTTTDVTFNVDMNYQITLGNFIVGTDFVDVAGDMNGWAGGDVLTDPDSDGIYSYTFTGVAIGTTWEYKFRINGTSWEALSNNRSYTSIVGTNVVDHFYNDDAGPVNVTFTIIDGTQTNLDIELKGTFTSWSLVQMYDDGTNGDAVANDHTWSLTYAVGGGSHEWGAVENDGSANGLWLIVGSNPALTVNTDGTYTGQDSYEIPAPGNLDVVFNVNMNYQITLGNFTVGTDFVDLAGSMNGWGGSAAMDDTDGDGIYSITYGGFSPNDVAEYKFRINGTAWEGSISNREYTVVDPGPNEVTHWFDNAMPPMPDDIFFSEYIEGSSNNKALEIYNGTGATVNLDDYIIRANYNGNPYNGFHTFPVGATLADGEVWVIVNSSADSVFLAAADETFPYNGSAYIVGFNGDDTRGLFKISGSDTILIDIIGQELIDPGSGWDVAGTTVATANHTMVRKPSITTGTQNWASSAGTDEANSEWIVYPSNESQYLGSHPHILNDLFISEYIEGSSNNKTLEIYNGTGDPVDLSVYTIKLARNGAGWGMYDLTTPQPEFIYNLTGIIANNDVYVLAADAAGLDILSVSDTALSYPSVCHFNGDDAIGLFKNDVLIDVIGDPSVDPGSGWDVAGVLEATSNQTLVRKATITVGNTDWTISAGTDAASSEWVVLVQDEFSYLGTHPHTFATTTDVTFNVDMSYQITLGNFVVGTDFLDIAGTVNAWAGGDVLTDPDGDEIYSLTLTGILVGDTLEFKFRINGDWNNSEFPGGGPNRLYITQSSGNVLDYWYNDDEPVTVVTIYDIQYTTDPSGDSPYNGQFVTTSGLVTAVDNGSYFIQDGIGAWNGVYVYDNSNAPALGDHITISLEVDEYYGLTELKNVTSFTVNSSGNTLPPPSVITALDANMEMYEGVLIQVLNGSCTNPDLGYGEWLINDGIGDLVVDEAIYAYIPTLGSTYNITGVLNYSYSAFKIAPRDSADIEDISVVGDIQTLSIPSGWSIFSTYVNPFDPLMNVVFASIVSDVNLIKNGSGQVYWPAFSLNAIGNLTIGEGYQINLTTAQTLDITGTQVVPETTIMTIPQGWSIIGYLRTSPGDAAAMLATISTEIVICKNGSGQVYWPLYSLNMIGNLIPGEGYQINMLTTQTFSYPANGPVAKSSASSYLPSHYIHNLNTGCNMTLGIPSSSWTTIPNIGDEVGVFTNSGLLVGSSVFTNDNMAITIWGTNEYSDMAMSIGESFIIKVWNNLSNSETVINVNSWLSGDEYFKTDGISVVSDLDNGTTLENYPNPASYYTEIVYTLSNDTYVNLSIYNSIGELVEVLVSGSVNSGTYRVMLNTSIYEAGTYFYVLNTNEGIKTNSLQIVK